MASYKKNQEVFILKTFYSSGDLTLCEGGKKILLGNFYFVAHVVEPVGIIYRSVEQLTKL